MGQGSSVALSCGADHRCGSDLALLWLWHRPAATAPIRPLSWEHPYATGAALKGKKDKKKKKSMCIYIYVYMCVCLNNDELDLMSIFAFENPFIKYSWPPN